MAHAHSCCDTCSALQPASWSKLVQEGQLAHRRTRSGVVKPSTVCCLLQGTLQPADSTPEDAGGLISDSAVKVAVVVSDPVSRRCSVVWCCGATCVYAVGCWSIKLPS